MQMRELISIVEEASRTFYHGSRRALASGTKLRPGINHSEPEEHAVEEILEHFRPAHCLSRLKSVFMVEQPDADLIERAGGYADFILEVEPLGKIERNDVAWWSRILTSGAYDYADGDKSVLDECRQLAEAYWAGKSTERPVWEIRASGATIIRVAGENQ